MGFQLEYRFDQNFFQLVFLSLSGRKKYLRERWFWRLFPILRDQPNEGKTHLVSGLRRCLQISRQFACRLGLAPREASKLREIVKMLNSGWSQHFDVVWDLFRMSLKDFSGVFLKKIQYITWMHRKEISLLSVLPPMRRPPCLRCL